MRSLCCVVSLNCLTDCKWNSLSQRTVERGPGVGVGCHIFLNLNLISGEKTLQGNHLDAMLHVKYISIIIDPIESIILRRCG